MHSKNPILWHLALPVLFLTIIFSARAAGPQLLQNFNTQRPFTFEENKCQLADEKGNLLPDILYFGKDKGLNVYCFKDKIAFVFTKTDTYKKSLTKQDSVHQHFLHGKLKDNSADFSVVTASRMEMQFVAANPNPAVTSEEPQEAYSNYYLAHCTNGITAHSFNKLTYKNIYPSVDLVLSTTGKGMKYSFVVHPGGDVNSIRMQWSGADSMQYLQEQGVISYANSLGSLQEGKLSAFVDEGEKVNCSYKIQGNEVGFDVKSYDKRRMLVIDPIFTWSTYFGGSNDDSVTSIKTDNNHHIYLVGATKSTSGIATSGAYQTNLSGKSNGFIVKFTDLGGIDWSTYYGGEVRDNIVDLKLCKHGDIYVVGSTNSTKGIATSGTFQSSMMGIGAMFVAKFSASGIRNWGTYFSGAYKTFSLAVDSSDDVYACSSAALLGLATSGAYQTSLYGGGDLILVKFDNNGQRIWSTYYGGTRGANCYGLATDLSGNVYVTGETESNNHIATSGAYSTSLPMFSVAAFIAGFNADGSIKYGTYYGEGVNNRVGYSFGYGINADDSGNVIVVGYTGNDTLITTPGTYQEKHGGAGDAFMVKFNPKGKRLWGTYLGGGKEDYARDITKDIYGNIFIVGSTRSNNGIATKEAYQKSSGGGSDAFLAKFSPQADKAWVTYFGGKGQDFGVGVAVDTFGNTFIAGTTSSDSGISSSGAYQKNYGGGTISYGDGLYGDAFIVKFRTYDNDAGVSKITGRQNFCSGKDSISCLIKNFGARELDSFVINWSVNGKLQTPYNWKGRLRKHDSTIITFAGHSFSPGIDTLLCWTSKPNGVTDSVTNNDSAKAIDSIYSHPIVRTGGNHTICTGQSITIGSLRVANHAYSWSSKPAGFSSFYSNPSVSPTQTTTYYLTETNLPFGCSSMDSLIITVRPSPKAKTGLPKEICYGNSLRIGDSDVSGNIYSWVSLPKGFTSNSSTPLINPSVTTTFYLTEIDTITGCSKTDSVLITVNPLPDVKVGLPRHIICRNDTAYLGRKIGLAGNTYYWTSRPSGFTSNTPNAAVSPENTTTYYLTMTNTTTGCSNTDSVIVMVDTIKAEAGPDKIICAGESVILGSAAISGYSYFWRSGQSGFTDYKPNPVVSPAKTTIYYLTETTATGCSKTDSVTITVDTVKASAGENRAICSGESVTLGSTAISGLSYAWTSIPSGFTAYTSGPVVSPVKTTTYYLTANNTATGCTAKDSVTITVHSRPSVSSYGRPVDVCAGTSNAIALTTDTSFTKDTAAYTYKWRSAKANVLLNADKDTAIISWNNTGTDTAWVIVSNKYGCKDSARFIVTVHPLPDAHFSLSSTGDVYTFRADDNTLDSYTWSYGDSSAKDTGHAGSHIFSHNRNYKITLIAANGFGCASSFDSTVSITSSGLAENVNESNNSISIYPNPFSSITTLSYALDKPSQVSIEVLDMQGRKVATLAEGNQLMGAHSCEFDAARYNCSAGIYLVKVLIADQLMVRRVIRID